MAHVLKVLEAAQEAKRLNLSLPISDDCRHNTKNFHGFMYAKITENDEKFIDIARNAGLKSLDIGCAYGHVCLEAVKLGSTHFVAVDMEPDHLKILASELVEKYPKNTDQVTLIAGAFPKPDLMDILLKNNPSEFDAILARNIFIFLHESEIQPAFDAVYKLLKPGGKFFATNLSPYVKSFKREVRDEFDLKLKAFSEDETKHVPGFLPCYRDAIDENQMKKCGQNCDKLAWPKGHFFMFQADTVKYFLTKAGFEIVEITYDKTEWPEVFKLDGREFVTLVAKKP